MDRTCHSAPAAPLEIVAAVNDPTTLHENLLRSPEAIRGRARVVAESGFGSAGQAYNSGLRHTTGEFVAFVHQDVYLPDGWVESVLASLDRLAASGVPMGVLGVWGVASFGGLAGRVWCSGGNAEHRGPVPGGCVEVASIDEIVIVIRRSSGLRFDENLPGFHLYATDIILQARSRGLGAFVVDAPVVHNSRCNPQPLDRAYRAAYRYMQRKWAAELPVRTCVVDVTRWGWPLYRQWARNEVARLRGRVVARPRHQDPRPIAAALGYEGRAASPLA